MKSNKFTVKFFPFSPGIPWKVHLGRYINPALNSDVWVSCISPAKNINIVMDSSRCGLIESYFSLCYLELINSIYPGKNINYYGNNKFHKLIKYNGLAVVQPNNFDSNFLNKYPVPIFMDKNKNVYFNMLNNFIRVSSYYGRFGYIDNKALLSQLWRNSSVSKWDKLYLPQFRYKNFENVDKWIREHSFFKNKPYVCIFPNTSGLSVHSEQMLNWSVQQVKAFCSLLKQAGYSPIIFSSNIYHYLGEYVAPLDIDFILYFLMETKAILANDVDFLLMSMMLNNKCKIFGLKRRDFTSLAKNSKFLGSGNVIYKDKDLTPVTVFNNLVKNG